MDTAEIIEIHNVDLDEEILSHLATTEGVEAFRAEKLSPDLIEDEAIREIYKWQMGHLREHGRAATASVLAEEFDLNLLDPLTVPYDLIDRLRVRWMNNNARDHIQEVADAFKEDPRLVPTKMIQVGRELGRYVNPAGESYGTGDYDRVMAAYDKQTLAGEGPSLGYKELDSYFHGLRGVSIIIGPPKSYKSWGGVKCALENVVDGRAAHIYSLELPAVETNQRLYALAANIPPWKWIKGGLTKEDRNLVAECAEVLDGSGLYKIEKPEQGKRGIEYLVENARDQGADLVIIDQLQYVEMANGDSLGSGKPQDYWNILNKARDLSDEGPILFIHQFNRTAMYADEMPVMQQAKGGSACEEVASLIMGLWANKSMRQSGIVEFGAIASRWHREQSWEISVDLTKGCKFNCLGVVDHDES